MRLISSIITSSLLFSLAIPFASAEFDLNELYNRVCRIRLGISQEKALLGAQAFNVNRCVVKLKNKRERRDSLKRDKMRENIKQEAITEKMTKDKVTRRYLRALNNQQWMRSLQNQKRTRALEIKQEIKSLNAERRSGVHLREREKSMEHGERIRAIRDIKEGCKGLRSLDRWYCIQKQLHNLNLLDLQ